jgi:hypothetical protein
MPPRVVRIPEIHCNIATLVTDQRERLQCHSSLNSGHAGPGLTPPSHDGIRQRLRTTQAQAQAMGEASKLDIPAETKNLLMKSFPAARWDIVNLVRPTASLAAVD